MSCNCGWTAGKKSAGKATAAYKFRGDTQITMCPECATELSTRENNCRGI
jgi:chloramphenicol 3-O-phosphotransferase